MERPLRIALTGGIASGKSTVAARFSELAIPVIDADLAARAVVRPTEPALAEIRSEFGPGALDARGQLDRAALRTLAFGDPKQLKKLEQILHPRIREWMLRRSEQAGGPYQIWEIPLLVESGWHDAADRVLVVDCPVEVQIARVMHRDRCTESEARRILERQASREQRLAVADDVIDNTGDIASLDAAVMKLHYRYLELARVRNDESVSRGAR